MKVWPVPCAADFAKKDKRRTMGLWSMIGPDFDLRVREGLRIT